MVDPGALPINLLFYAFSIVAFEKNLILWTVQKIHGINPLKGKQKKSPNISRKLLKLQFWNKLNKK